MKKFDKIYLSLLSVLLVTGACNKDLDLKPHQSIEQSQAILTAQDVQITLVGAYNRAGLADLYGGGAFLYPDLMATQTVFSWNGTFQGLTQLTDQSIPTDNGFINSTWADAYQVINQANNVLANLTLVTPENRDRTEGEAKFLRGLVYFDLARLFGRAYNDGDPTTNLAAPIVLTPTTVITDASYVSRSTVAQVYQQAITDLTTAEAKLPEDNSYFAGKYAAAAILARLYLQQKDYAKAITEATTVINSGSYSLNKSYAAEFPYPNSTAVHVDNTVEDIFAMQVTDQQGTNALNTYYASKTNGGRGDIHINDSFLDLFSDSDSRKDLYQYDDPTDNTTTLRCRKFDNLDGNVHVIRLAELYLIRAEANFYNKTATGQSPVDDINVIRNRAGATPVSTIAVSSTGLPTTILNERVLELAFEGGFFLHDAKRTSTTSAQVTVGALPAFSPKLVFPIPLQDINANPKLIQNPGYN